MTKDFDVWEMDDGSSRNVSYFSVNDKYFRERKIGFTIQLSTKWEDDMMR